MAVPVRDRGGRYPPRIRHLSGPLAPPWYMRSRWVVPVLGVLIVLAHYPSRDRFWEDSSFRRNPNMRRHALQGDGSFFVIPAAVLVVVLRRHVLRFARARCRVLADAQDDGGWRAAVATAALNAGYVLVVIGPVRWALTRALTAYATGSDRFRAADEVVAEAVARYVDRGTVLVLLVMTLEACLVHLAGRGRRRLGLRD